MKDTIRNADHYFEFYEEIGRNYPEAELVHATRPPGSRYRTVLHELLPFARQSGHLLDVGCNDGVYTIPYCEEGGRALGIDISPSLIRKAKGKAAGKDIECEFKQADIEDPETVGTIQERFEVILLSEVLEHLRHPGRALKNIHELLNPGGILLLTTPTPLFEDISQLTVEYVIETLRGRRLSESQIIDTTKIPVFHDYDVSAYLYRHDGYYPRALRVYVESFGLSCLKSYTIGLPTHPALRGLASFFGIEGRSPGGHETDVGQGPDRRLLRRIDFVMRRVPIANLLGRTNIGLFKDSLTLPGP